MTDKNYQSYQSQFFDKYILKVRKRIYQKIESQFPLDNIKMILDVGVTADQSHVHSNFFEKMYPYSDRITALSDQDASQMEQEYKGLKFVQADGRKLPFPDNSFELVFSSATLEHVGSYDCQKKFLSEMYRVSSKYIC